MAYKIGSCKNCAQRREKIIAKANEIKHIVKRIVRKPEGKK